MQDLNHLWETVKSQIFLEMIEVHYNTWIKPLIPLKIKGDTIYLYSNVGFVSKIVNDKYKETIEEKFKNILNPLVNVVILSPTDDLLIELQNESDDDSSENTGQLEMGYYGAIDVTKDVIEKPTPKTYLYKDTLNKKHTFSNFVRGKSNDLALAIALNVADNPGTIYNPYFIYGSSGLGKTHLMQAIGNKIIENDPSKKVIYITSENFMNEFIQTITDSKNSVTNSKIFRDKYRNCDVLMIDDIQFISGKESTQEEIFHTFNSLQAAKKQIIFTSDKKPEEIKGLEDRLVTRFSGGMIADIQKPDFETRVAILNHKVKMDRYDVPNSVIEFIAENVTSNIRNLEGAILKVMAFYNLEKQRNAFPIDDEDFLEIAKKALAIEEKKKKPITLESIKQVVANYYGLEPNDLIVQNRQKSVSDPRQIAMYISRKYTSSSLVKIANSFERDHATVLYGFEKINNLIKTDLATKKEIENILAILNGD
ncbi:chromosomal replication initiator protein DnaA [Helcococcus sueciensis]|uniref:chromosomal replication initiator protein DnaA n=1 Tax=Helcococcus sueciensis TaxID=241555 RepID=UPI000412C80B|nr:chromosomal replication initiator protein DnaA [Helcococcus sueciensis]